jgi:hypothetical protein
MYNKGCVFSENFITFTDYGKYYVKKIRLGLGSGSEPDPNPARPWRSGSSRIHNTAVYSPQDGTSTHLRMRPVLTSGWDRSPQDGTSTHLRMGPVLLLFLLLLVLHELFVLHLLQVVQDLLLLLCLLLRQLEPKNIFVVGNITNFS